MTTNSSNYLRKATGHCYKFLKELGMDERFSLGSLKEGLSQEMSFEVDK